MFSSILLAPLLLGASLAAPLLEHRQSSCAPVHIIAARGSNEAPGPGAMASLAALIQAAYPGTDLESINYPAKLFPYDDSSAQGTAATTSQLTNYVNACPNSKIVMIGYSQVSQHVVPAEPKAKYPLSGRPDHPRLPLRRWRSFWSRRCDASHRPRHQLARHRHSPIRRPTTHCQRAIRRRYL